MAKRKYVKKERPSFSLGLREETRYAVLAVLSFLVSLFLLLSAFDKTGFVGRSVFTWLSELLGIGYYLLPAVALLLSVGYFRFEKANFAFTNTVGSFLFVLSGLGLIELGFPEHGGLIGTWVTYPLTYLLDIVGSLTVLIATFLISLLILFNAHPVALWRSWREKHKARRNEKTKEQVCPMEDKVEIVAPPDTPPHTESEPPAESSPEEAEPKKKKGGLFSFGKKDDEEFLPIQAIAGAYTPPPLSIFSRDSGKPGVGDIKANANIIKRTLQNFGIDVAMDEISIGPSVTRYAMKPAEGVRLNKILGLQKNLELTLAAHPVRIEAPIPGKALVGIEVPNSAKTTVGLATLLTEDEYARSPHPLMVTLGRDVDGNAIFSNVAKMPHILIAGATGSGKSVTIHAFINSLLFRNGPNTMRFVMIDPKRVELTLYNGIPHLLTPVITDAKKAILSLKWLTKEMERRYNVLEEHRVRDISSYHESVVGKSDVVRSTENPDAPETMPYIIVVIDELADIMSTYPRELEAAIVRLAQMSRAVGIHLILSTQRPSVNVITGLIKANIPARVALQVASQIDSRTILDTSGAEKLLGAGDMLFQSGDMGKPKRIQSAFISEKEVKKVTEFLRRNDDGSADSGIVIDLGSTENGGSGLSFDDADEIDDDLFEDARETVIRAGKASTSYLQRKLRIGYSRAARLMDILEEQGIIGPADGSKPRDVLIRRPDQTTNEEE